MSIAPDSPARGHGEITLSLSRRRKLAVGGVLVLGGVAAAVAFALPGPDLTGVPAATFRLRVSFIRSPLGRAPVWSGAIDTEARSAGHARG